MIPFALAPHSLMNLSENEYERVLSARRSRTINNLYVRVSRWKERNIRADASVCIRVTILFPFIKQTINYLTIFPNWSFACAIILISFSEGELLSNNLTIDQKSIESRVLTEIRDWQKSYIVDSAGIITIARGNRWRELKREQSRLCNVGPRSKRARINAAG